MHLLIFCNGKKIFWIILEHKAVTENMSFNSIILILRWFGFILINRIQLESQMTLKKIVLLLVRYAFVR